MLGESVFKRLGKSIEEIIDLNDVRVILALSLVENTFEFRNVYVYTIGPLFNTHQLRCYFTCLVQVEVYIRELIENRLIVLNSSFLSVYEL